MKTLTYGTLPSIKTFNQAFRDYVQDETFCLSMRRTSADAINLRQAGLLTDNTSDRYTTIANGGGRVFVFYNKKQLYRLCTNLVELYEIDSDEQFSEWAGTFASNIMNTLGFEWI